LAAVVFIAVYAQPVPYWDEWVEPIDNALKTAEGTLGFADLTRQYNDSRPFFTNLLTVGSTLVLGWNLEAEMFFNQLLALLTLVLLGSILQRHMGDQAIWVIPLFSMLVFSLTQRQSLLWAIQSQYYFMILFFSAAFWFLDTTRPRWPALWAGAVFACCTTFSFANGFLVWVCALPVLWMLGYRTSRYFLFWFLAGTSCLALFFRNYTFRGLGFEGLTDPLLISKFTLACLGNALVGHSGTSTSTSLTTIAAIGGIGLLIFGVNVIFLLRCPRQRQRWAVWLGLALFAVASSGLAALGRASPDGGATGLANRYVTLSLVFWIALVGIGAETIHALSLRAAPSRSSRLAVAANGLAGVVLISLLLFFGHRSAKMPTRVTPAHRVCLERAPVTRDLTCFEGLHPIFNPSHTNSLGQSMALDRIDRLAALELGVFSTSD